MTTTFVVVTVLAATANLVIAGFDLRRHPFVLANMAQVGVPESWLVPLASAKALGGLGLLVGLVLAPVGVAAAAGLCLFFAGALVTHARAREWSLTFPLGYLGLAVAALVTRIATL